MDVVIDNPESRPETIAWRNNRLQLWAKLRERRDTDFAQAARFTTSDRARQYAMERARGEVKWFMADVLRRSSATAAASFVNEAPYGWFETPEILLDTGELVPRLIRRSYASPSFAAKLQDLEKRKAEIDAYWGPWIRDWMTTLEQEAGVRIDNAAAAAAEVGSSVAQGFDLAKKVLKYGPPVLLGGAALMGVWAVSGAFRSRRGDSDDLG